MPRFSADGSATITRNTRSKSCGRLSNEAHKTTSPYAKQQSLNQRASRSPAHEPSLPAKKINNTSGTQVNLPSSKTISPQINKSKNKLSKENYQEAVTINAPPNTPLSLKLLASKVQPARPALKGDNRGLDFTVNGTINTAKEMEGKKDEDLSLILKGVRDDLKEIKNQMVKLDKIETTTTSLAEQLTAVVNRTTELETSVKNNTTQLREVETNLATLENKIQKQGKTISGITDIKKDLKETKKQISDITANQKQQDDNLKSELETIEARVLREVDRRMDQFKQEARCQSLKDQAFKTRHNLIITGLQEDKDKSTLTLVQEHVENSMKIQEVTINSAYRIGPQPGEDSNYDRPIIVKFHNIMHRNIVWKNRVEITRDDCDKKIRIQADLPKALREGVQNLYKVAKAATKFPEYENAQVRDFQLELNGKSYQFTELENLPQEIKPSTLAAPTSNTTMVFFSRNSILSNHHPSRFIIDGKTFHTMEHYLALQRAVLSGNKALIKKAKAASDPRQAKYILNTLREDHKEEWAQMREEITLEGLREKFSQNPSLKAYLCDTQPLILIPQR